MTVAVTVALRLTTTQETGSNIVIDFLVRYALNPSALTMADGFLYI